MRLISGEQTTLNVISGGTERGLTWTGLAPRLAGKTDIAHRWMKCARACVLLSALSLHSFNDQYLLSVCLCVFVATRDACRFISITSVYTL